MSKTHVTTTINGEPMEFLTDASSSLLDVLRGPLGLTGTKEGCGTGDCGACSVTVDGRLMCSCLMLAVQSDGCQVRTVESLGQPDALSPLQKAFADHHALQCGFCTPGFLMTVQTWLDQAPADATLTDAQLRDLLSGNVCRCTGYQNIVDAVRAVLAGRGVRVVAEVAP